MNPWWFIVFTVLILILMEHSLTTNRMVEQYGAFACLNPYSNGTLSDVVSGEYNVWASVLILILMEHSLT